MRLLDIVPVVPQQEQVASTIDIVEADGNDQEQERDADTHNMELEEADDGEEDEMNPEQDGEAEADNATTP